MISRVTSIVLWSADRLMGIVDESFLSSERIIWPGFAFDELGLLPNNLVWWNLEKCAYDVYKLVEWWYLLLTDDLLYVLDMKDSIGGDKLDDTMTANDE